MSRADVQEDERADCTVVIDEFHSYVVDGNTTIADALAESRKYRTNYVLSTQMLASRGDLINDDDRRVIFLRQFAGPTGETRCYEANAA